MRVAKHLGMRNAPEAETQLALEAVLPTRLSLAPPPAADGTVAGALLMDLLDLERDLDPADLLADPVEAPAAALVPVERRPPLPRAPASTTPLPRARPPASPGLDLGAQLEAICARATRDPQITGTLDAFHALEVPAPASPLATIEPWPLPAPAPAPEPVLAPLPFPGPVVTHISRALTPAPGVATSTTTGHGWTARVEVALLYTTVSLATFLGTVALLY